MVLMEDMDVEHVESLVESLVESHVERQQKNVEQKEEVVDVEQKRVNSVNVNPSINLKYNYF